MSPKSDREISEFLLRACHDLRTPARAVRLHSELFLKQAGETPDSGVQERLGFIVEGARRIDVLLDGIASYSVALQIDPASFQPARMDVLLRFVLAKLANPLRECGGEVKYGELPTVTGNPDRLMQLFENLLRNALDHRGDAAPRIEIAARLEADAWIFSVRDNGPGLEADVIENIFLPFERLQCKDSRRAGLGLAICRVIVERHGGRIWAESPDGGGTAICFTLAAQ